jgi:hypothetical protein
VAAPPDVAAVAALVAAQEAAREQLASQARNLVEQAVTNFPDWYDTDAITTWATQTASLVESVLRALAAMIDAYFASITGQILGRWVRPSGPIDVSGLRVGVTPAGVYGRVADVYRFQQAQWDQAATGLVDGSTTGVPDLVPPIHAALDRAEQVTNLSTQLVARDQARASLSAQEQQGLITGWRRVPHPELSKGGTCGLCWAASTRIYKTGELMPIHHDCHCLPMPVTAEHDIGSIINDQDLGTLYGDAGSTDAAALKRTRYRIDEHGELGPLLSPAGEPIRTARQAKAAENRPPRRPSTPGQARSNLQRKRDGLAPALARLDQMAAGDPSWEPFRQAVAERVADLDHQLAQTA